MKKRVFFFVGLLVLFLAIVFAGGLKELAAKEVSKEHLVEVLAGPRGFDLISGTIVADILTKYHPRIRASAVKTEDVDSHLPQAEKRDPDMLVYNMNNNVYMTNCLPGIADPLYKNTRWIATWHSEFMHFVTLNPEIKSLADCAGKKITVWPGPETKGTNLVIAETLKALGVYDRVTLKHTGLKASQDALRDGLVDVALTVTMGGLATSKTDLSSFLVETLAAKKNKAYAVAWPHAALEKVKAKLGYARIPGFLPAGTLPTQTEPVESTICVVPALACHKDADEEIIYEITKCLAENSHRFKEYNPAFEHVNPQSMVRLLPLYSEKEVHPGAIKYYKEIGVWEENWKNRYVVGPKILD